MEFRLAKEWVYTKSGYDLTKHWEQCRLVAFKHKGDVWTIGWGHTRGVHEGQTCTQAEADAWLVADLVFAQLEVQTHVSIPITQNEYNALVDFVYNLGGGAFEKSTLRADLNAGNFAAAADEFKKWDHAAGKELAGLLARRQEEAELFRTIQA